ncbi:MAG TPA: pyruvate kinase [Vicinamibacterales bacterium]|jgi:pyruvate kinase
MRHTKIIATVGPASDSDAVLDSLISAGTDIFRLNFSHGTHASQGAAYARIRAAAARAHRDVAILQDLGGPKIRTGLLVDHKSFAAKAGDTLVIATGDFAGRPGRVSTTFAALAKSVRHGDRLLLADGTVELHVEATDGTEITTKVVDGGEVGENKGINAPGVELPAAAITEKDVEDLKFGVSLGVDLIGLSFVQTAADLRQARQLLADAGAAETLIVAKLERPRAVENLAAILEASDAVMVARGDLGLELPLEHVPRVQKEVTRQARRAGKPVIVATQVLESMTFEARPTRAEVNDAANAVDDGVDAIMLAGETAAGAYPSRAVQTLDAIIRDAEASPEFEMRSVVPSGAHYDHEQALCEAAVTLAERSDARAIVAVTRGGTTARRLSTLRPHAPIVAATERDITARRLALYWGVVPIQMAIGDNLDEASARIGTALVERGMVASGAAAVFVSVSADLGRTDANYLKIRRL